MTDLQLILSELRELRSSFNEHAADTGRRLTALETQLDRVLAPAGPVLVPRARKSRQ
jgi:hypothetical protein